ncbi:putative serine/threonine-protein kinase [Cocos nucifera]|uniref:non-specific serine/threonine protein kinase n=1 Tax=Cocos nucifera TaxID=13894 RepID=A0A8K0IME8_COCNU|nr:putative serine/threonine-protein kinase [Cocos nucifera]
MSFWDPNFLNSELSKPTSIFGLKLWVVIVICVGVAIVLVLFLLSLCHASHRRRRPAAAATATATAGKPHKLHLHDPTPPVSKDIPEIVHHRERAPSAAAEVRIDIGGKAARGVVLAEQHRPVAPVLASPSASTTGTVSGESRGTVEGTTPSMGEERPPEVSHLGWGHWYTLREMEDATGGFAEATVIGKGEYGIVYRGVLADNTMVAIKNLLNNRGQAEKEFRMVVETIGRIRHKNLVSLLGYCVEGAYRMLVYEYVDNGNLDQWLHGDVGEVSPLTWDIRMKIILGTAKGLAYLHEGLEPKVVHRDVKSSNILLDRQWNPKVSDFGLAKLLGSERSYVTTRVMGTFGYVAPEYVSTGMLNDRSDVYSFGVLIMEIISGRTPVDYTRPPGEVNLVEWLKNTVGDRKAEQVVDPKMLEKPYPKALKRALLVALRIAKLGEKLLLSHWTATTRERREASAGVTIGQGGDDRIK